MKGLGAHKTLLIAGIVVLAILSLIALVADGVEWLVVKPTARPDSLADLKASIDYLRRLHPRK